MSNAEIKTMSRDEQLLAMEMLWDELCHQKEEPASPDWHGDILASRLGKVAEDSAEYLTISEVKERFRK